MRSGDVDQPRLRRVVDLLIRDSGVRSEWFEMFGTMFFDESDLSQVGLGQSRRFPVWRQRTGSASLDVSEGGNRTGGPPAITPIDKTPPSHREPPPTTTSGLLPPRWKALRMVINKPPEHVDEICLRCDTPSMSCSTANMPHGHIMAVTARSKIAKSENAENAVPLWSVCPFALTHARGQSTPNSLERVNTGPGLESLCRPSPWLAGRDRGPWLELSARFGNRRSCSINNRSLS